MRRDASKFGFCIKSVENQVVTSRYALILNHYISWVKTLPKIKENPKSEKYAFQRAFYNPFSKTQKLKFFVCLLFQAFLAECLFIFRFSNSNLM